MKALLEIYLEDLPPSEFPALLNQMKEKMENILKERELEFSSVESGMTVRRLYIKIDGLPEKQSDKVVERKGPPENIAYKDGEPTKALEGFLKKFGASIDDVVLKDGYVYVSQSIKGKETLEILPEVFVEFINSLDFRKPMKWADGKYSFVRPVHGVLALLDDEVVDFEVFGIKSSNRTKGHRFFGKEVTIEKIDEYENKLFDEFVIASLDKRMKKIREQLFVDGYTVDMDEELIEEVAYLTEFPRAVVGNFDKKYLSLPQEVIITTVKHHERTFATFKEKKITQVFIGFQDGPDDPEGNVRKGFERVINARLEDARYYFEKDIKSSFEEWNEELKGMIFQKELGTLYDKVLRIKEISMDIANQIGYEKKDLLERAATISKADIASKVVYEFPELQGVMGRIYALKWGEDEEVAWALEEQYYDEPKGELGSLIGSADRLDTIVGNFLIGNLPKGSKDPFGLRGKADYIYASVDKFKWNIDLERLLNLAKNLLKVDSDLNSLENFMKNRFRLYLESTGVEWDVARAVEHLWKEPLRGILSAKALNKIIDSKDLIDLRVGFERVHNMASKHNSMEYEGALLKEDAEVSLINKFYEVKEKVLKALENFDYDIAYQSLIELKPYIDRYFDEVFVMVNREDIRRSRLGFLKNVDDLFMKVADLTQISKERVI